jgi:flagellar biosynthetic protein FlhB
MAGGNSDRSEKPTGRRLQKTREEGRVARSQEVAHVATLIAALFALSVLGGSMVGRLRAATQQGLERLGQRPLADLTIGDLQGHVLDGIRLMFMIVGPFSLAIAVAVVGVQSMQGGWMFSTKALKLDFNRLNPATGIKRLGLKLGGLDLLRTLVAATVVGVLCYQAITLLVRTSASLAGMAPAVAALEGWRAADGLLRRTAVALVAIAFADYGIQKWRFTNSLKMSKEEVKQDAKETDGNPEIKARVRRIQREMTRRRMMKAVPRATVIITNPTHYAVALEYRRASMPAPLVVAKGKNLIAQRIKDIGREHNVPVVENVALAQALYKGVDVGGFVPGDLFEAVAEVLAYLIRLKQLVL